MALKQFTPYMSGPPCPKLCSMAFWAQIPNSCIRGPFGICRRVSALTMSTLSPQAFRVWDSGFEVPKAYHTVR